MKETIFMQINSSYIYIVYILHIKKRENPLISLIMLTMVMNKSNKNL